MPDTTYLIKNENGETRIQLPGEKDTIIYINESQLPPHLNPILKVHELLELRKQEAKDPVHPAVQALAWFLVFVIAIQLLRSQTSVKDIGKHLRTGRTDAWIKLTLLILLAGAITTLYYSYPIISICILILALGLAVEFRRELAGSKISYFMKPDNAPNPEPDI